MPLNVGKTDDGTPFAGYGTLGFPPGDISMGHWVRSIADGTTASSAAFPLRQAMQQPW